MKTQEISVEEKKTIKLALQIRHILVQTKD